jgi:hypothetical protein
MSLLWGQDEGDPRVPTPLHTAPAPTMDLPFIAVVRANFGELARKLRANFLDIVEIEARERWFYDQDVICIFEI